MSQMKYIVTEVSHRQGETFVYLEVYRVGIPTGEDLPQVLISPRLRYKPENYFVKVNDTFDIEVT